MSEPGRSLAARLADLVRPGIHVTVVDSGQIAPNGADRFFGHSAILLRIDHHVPTTPFLVFLVNWDDVRLSDAERTLWVADVVREGLPTMLEIVYLLAAFIIGGAVGYCGGGVRARNELASLLSREIARVRQQDAQAQRLRDREP